MSISQYIHETPVSEIISDLFAVGAPEIGENGVYHWRKPGRRVPPKWVPFVADAARYRGIDISREDERTAIVRFDSQSTSS